MMTPQRHIRQSQPASRHVGYGQARAETSAREPSAASYSICAAGWPGSAHGIARARSQAETCRLAGPPGPAGRRRRVQAADRRLYPRTCPGPASMYMIAAGSDHAHDLDRRLGAARPHPDSTVNPAYGNRRHWDTVQSRRGRRPHGRLPGNGCSRATSCPVRRKRSTAERPHGRGELRPPAGRANLRCCPSWTTGGCAADRPGRPILPLGVLDELGVSRQRIIASSSTWRRARPPRCTTPTPTTARGGGHVSRRRARPSRSRGRCQSATERRGARTCRSRAREGYAAPAGRWSPRARLTCDATTRRGIRADDGYVLTCQSLR